MPQSIYLTASKYDANRPSLSQVLNLLQTRFPDKSVQLLVIDPDDIRLPENVEAEKSILLHCSYSFLHERGEDQFRWDTLLFQAQNHGYLFIFDNLMPKMDESNVFPLKNSRKIRLREYGIDESSFEAYLNLFALDIQQISQSEFFPFVEKICSDTFPQRKKLTIQTEVSLISHVIPYIASFTAGAIVGFGIGASISYFAAFAPPLMITFWILGAIIGGLVGLALCLSVQEYNNYSPSSQPSKGSKIDSKLHGDIVYSELSSAQP